VTFYAVLTNPRTIIAGVVAGAVFGLYFPAASGSLHPYADIYVGLLAMCMLPILIFALIGGIGRMLRNPDTQELFPRMAMFFVIGLGIPSLTALAVVVIAQPGAGLSLEASTELGNKLLESAAPGAGSSGLLSFVASIVPTNIFAALSQGQFISVVFFCAVVGLAIGFVRSDAADLTLDIVDALYRTFALIFRWILVPLAPGLFCIVAANVAAADKKLLVAMVGFVGAFYLAGALCLVIYSLVAAYAARVAPWRPVHELRKPLILAFATDNPLLALYSSIEVLTERFRVRQDVADTVAPFGVMANQHGQVLVFTFLGLFLAQVYGVELTTVQIVTVLIACAISGTAAVGGGAVLMPILAPILLGAGIPDSLALVVLATTQTAIQPLSSALTVMATCTLTVLTDKPGAVRPRARITDSDAASAEASD
jgi:Na+/H+-dicarboxylate symporter